MSSDIRPDIRLELTRDGVALSLLAEPSFPSELEVSSGLCWSSALSERVAGPVP